MGTSHWLPGLLIFGGILFIGGGGVLGTLGWNEWARVNARIEMSLSLYEAARASSRTLTDAAQSDSFEKALPVETAQFTAALAGGLFVGSHHGQLREKIRRTQSVLTEYNYALSHKYAATVWAHGPKDLPLLAARGHDEVAGLIKS